jgi:hypothetical protein
LRPAPRRGTTSNSSSEGSPRPYQVHICTNGIHLAQCYVHRESRPAL